MEHIDKKLQEVLSKKFEGMEVDVDPAIWNAVNTSIQGNASADIGSNAGVAGTGKALTWLAWFGGAALIVGTLFFYNPSTEDKEVSSSIEEQLSPVQEKAQNVESTEEIVTTIETEEDLTKPAQHANNAIVGTPTIADIPVDEQKVSSNDEAVKGNHAENGVDNTGGDDTDHGSDSGSATEDNADERSKLPVQDPAVEEDVLPQNELYVEDTERIENEQILLIERPLPNVFSPNGDGVNDSYSPVFNSEAQGLYKVLSMSSGEVIFESENLSEGWSGIDRSGGPVKPGNYLYIVSVRLPDGTTDEATQLVRVFK